MSIMVFFRQMVEYDYFEIPLPATCGARDNAF